MSGIKVRGINVENDEYKSFSMMISVNSYNSLLKKILEEKDDSIIEINNNKNWRIILRRKDLIMLYVENGIESKEHTFVRMLGYSILVNFSSSRFVNRFIEEMRSAWEQELTGFITFTQSSSNRAKSIVRPDFINSIIQ